MPLTDASAVPAFAARTRWLEQYALRPRITERGVVVSVGDGIAWIRGLPSAATDDLLDLSDGSEALVFHLGRELLGAGPAAPDRCPDRRHVSVPHRSGSRD